MSSGILDEMARRWTVGRVSALIGGSLLLLVATVVLILILSAWRAASVWPEAMPAPFELPPPALPSTPGAEEALLRAEASYDGDGVSRDIWEILAAEGPPPAEQLDSWRGAEEALGQLDEVARAQGLQLALRDLQDQPWPTITILKLARCRLLRGWWRAARGQRAEALDDMTSTFHLGILLEQSGGNLLPVTVGNTIASLALVETRELLRSRPASREELEQLAALLDVAQRLPPGIIAGLTGDCLVTERACELFRGATVGDMSSLDPTDGGRAQRAGRESRWLFDIDRAIALLRQRCHQVLDYARLPGESRPEPPNWESLYMENPSLGRYLDNPGGRMIVDSLVFERWLLIDAFDLALTRRALARVELALELFRRDRGGWPEDLEDLEPRYLDPMPLDPFTDEPLRYERRPGEGAPLLSSAGAEGEEAGTLRLELRPFPEPEPEPESLAPSD